MQPVTIMVFPLSSTVGTVIQESFSAIMLVLLKKSWSEYKPGYVARVLSAERRCARPSVIYLAAKAFSSLPPTMDEQPLDAVYLTLQPIRRAARRIAAPPVSSYLTFFTLASRRRRLFFCHATLPLPIALR